jgi:hypothetical protein
MNIYIAVFIKASGGLYQKLLEVTVKKITDFLGGKTLLNEYDEVKIEKPGFKHLIRG